MGVITIDCMASIIIQCRLKVTSESWYSGVDVLIYGGGKLFRVHAVTTYVKRSVFSCCNKLSRRDDECRCS